MGNRNLIHIECMRIIAAFLVIFNHTRGKGFFLFAEYERGSFLYWLYMFPSIFCKVAVPLFFMISGALLLRRDISLKELWVKKILRLIVALIIFSAVTYVGLGWYKDTTVSILEFVEKLYTCEVSVVFWYLYAYIAFMISFPFLRAMVKGLSEHQYWYMMFIAIIVVGIVPSLEYLLFHGTWTIYGLIKPSWILTNIVFWPLVGFYIENVYDIQKCSGKKIGIGIFVSIIGIGISCYLTYYMHLQTGVCAEGVSQTFYDCFMVLPCVTVYLGMRYIFASCCLLKSVKRIILSISGCTFGIYLLHVVVKQYLAGLWSVFRKDWQLNKMLAASLFCLVVFLVCYVLTWVLKKIPGLKKIL